MTPNDPLLPAQPEAAPQVPLPTIHHPPPFWDYKDFFLFITFAFPSLIVAFLVVRLLTSFGALSAPFRVMLAQLIWYGLAFSLLYALLRLRYDQPFWRSLGWKRVSFWTALASLITGPLLAFGLGILAIILRTPEVELPFRQMFTDRPTMVLFGLFAVVLGPLAEELAFRGFLMPLLMRSFGAAAGILLTGVIFGSIHGYEYEWSWRHILLISMAGTVFGWARYRTGSLATAAFMHSTFNLAQFIAFVAQGRPI